MLKTRRKSNGPRALQAKRFKVAPYSPYKATQGMENHITSVLYPVCLVSVVDCIEHQGSTLQQGGLVHVLDNPGQEPSPVFYNKITILNNLTALNVVQLIPYSALIVRMPSCGQIQVQRIARPSIRTPAGPFRLALLPFAHVFVCRATNKTIPALSSSC
jgi:hypothetical protein